MTVGSGKFKYEVVDNWAKWPKGWLVNDVCAIAKNSKDVFYMFNRGEHPIIMLDKNGNFLGSWGEGQYPWGHGISITSDGSVWLTDLKTHTARKHTTDGKLLMELGTPGKPSDTGCVDYAAWYQVKRSAGPFNQPTHAVESSWGDIYVADGYGNARIHVFLPDGKLKFSWGDPGAGPGQFKLPHDIVFDSDGSLFVTEMDGMRIQHFTREGKFIEQWKGIERPAGMFMDKHGNFFVPELAQHMTFKAVTYPPLSPTPHVRILDHKGKTLAIIGAAKTEEECFVPGHFFAPHACFVDSDDSFFISEPIGTVIKLGRNVKPDVKSLQKFIPVK